MEPDLKLRADVAVEVMGWNEVNPGMWENRDAEPYQLLTTLPPYELSLDACREVLAEIERRGLWDRCLSHLLQQTNYTETPEWEWHLLAKVSAADICRAALQAVREAKET